MKYIYLAVLSAIFTVTVSGCAYNAFYATSNPGRPLTSAEIVKLNGIMFAYLNIPKEINFIAPPAARKAGNNFYQPSAVVQIVKSGQGNTGTNPAKAGFTVINGGDKKTIKTTPATKRQLDPFTVIVKKNALFLTVFTKKPTAVNKAFKIGGVAVTVKNIRYDKGYEVVTLSLVNSGPTITAQENFKYSNAGNTFMLKQFETIQNLTVVSRYKRGMSLCLRF